MPLLQRSRPGRQQSGSAGFTIIELLVVIAIIGILVNLIEPGIGLMREGAELVIENTQDPEFAAVASASVALAHDFDRIFREQRAILEPAARSRQDADLAAVRRNLRKLKKSQRELDQQVLPALERIYPGLRRRDKALARGLRKHLTTLSFNIRRDIHLKRFLLEAYRP